MTEASEEHQFCMWSTASWPIAKRTHPLTKSLQMLQWKLISNNIKCSTMVLPWRRHLASAKKLLEIKPIVMTWANHSPIPEDILQCHLNRQLRWIRRMRPTRSRYRLRWTHWLLKLHYIHWISKVSDTKKRLESFKTLDLISSTNREMPLQVIIFSSKSTSLKHMNQDNMIHNLQNNKRCNWTSNSHCSSGRISRCYLSFQLPKGRIRVHQTQVQAPFL